MTHAASPRRARIAEKPDGSEARSDAEPDDAGFALRYLPLRGIVALDLIARHDCRLYLAAQAQNISTSALSTQITRLEARLRANIVRSMAADHRRLELTEDGKLLVKALRAAMPALQHLSDTVRLVSHSTPATARDGASQRPTRHKARGGQFPADPEGDPMQSETRPVRHARGKT